MSVGHLSVGLHRNPTMLRMQRLAAQRAPQLLLALLVLVLVAIKPSALSVAGIVNALVYSAPVAVLALGAMWVLIAGGLDLSAGVGVSLCALVLGGLLQSGESLIAALAATLAAGLALGMVNGILVGVVGIPAFIATLATFEALQGGTLILGGATGTVILNNPALSFIGTGSVLRVPVPLIYAALVAFVLWWIAGFTRFGLHTFSVGSHREATAARGIPIFRQDVYVYLFSGVMTALTAILLVARVQIVDPHIAGLDTLLDAFAATILGGTSLFGGRGSVGGTVTGAVIVGLLTTSLITIGIGAQYMELVKGATVVAAVVVDAVVRTLE